MLGQLGAVTETETEFRSDSMIRYGTLIHAIQFNTIIVLLNATDVGIRKY